MVVGTLTENVDTLVLGSGPGGYVAAIRAAELGQKVTIVERDYIGGVCLNVGCIPSKALITAGHHRQAMLNGSPFGLASQGVSLDFSKTQDWKQNTVVHTLTSGVEMLLKKHHVQIVRGEARFVDNQTVSVATEDSASQYSFRHAIVATGSRPVEIPGFAFKGRVLDSTGALNLPEVPEHLIVIGGGVIGTELAGAYLNLGAKVTILEGLPRLLSGFDQELTKPAIDDLKQHGATIVTEAKAKSVEQSEDGVKVTYEVGGHEEVVAGSYVLVSVGRRPNTDEIGLNNTNVKMGERGLIEVNDQQQTSVPHIYAIGDIVAGPALAHKASFEAKIAAAAINGDDVHDDHYALPSVAYTNVEVASVGETPTTIKDKGLNAKAFKFPFAANGRAISMAETAGFIRLVVDQETQAVIGGQVTGAGASDLISELALAIENGLTVSDISLTIHPHPTLSEGIMDTAELAEGLPINI
ncbi:dihydrolipoyl dehydrogenase [Weissella halotolerans]|uniref:Dihydrolipoyl dehydrogenase n=1 Tax=Weissella halotolerans DSM 20190 TaxID=1123500 RepID=A0A0R2FYA7_9LACO|nr:dihydrolipoyl dehydrogenase [Weissella halotolerans]KRN33426.1 dihydrolipoamide dehydrogenase [Weissella halotolerans DSM 20190]